MVKGLLEKIIIIFVFVVGIFLGFNIKARFGWGGILVVGGTFIILALTRKIISKEEKPTNPEHSKTTSATID